MGIHGLMKLIAEECPGCVKEQELENFTGRKIAIDASMAMYQFLIAVRQMGPGGASAQLTNEAGEVTSHIQGMFNRTIRLMTCGIKPVYVFDGKPPTLKSGELEKRKAKRSKAEKDLAAAKESGEADDIDKFSRRLVRVTPQHNEDCKQLLRLMGVPVVTAPCEAEAQCAELAKHGKVYGVATEDMDALTFRTPKLLRKMTFSGAKQPILEVDGEMVLTGLGLSYAEFVDLCILCGCDYTDSIKGIGPKTALKLVRQFKSIENIIKALKKEKKYEVPADWVATRIRREDAEVLLKGDEEAQQALQEDDAAALKEAQEKQEEATINAEEKENTLNASSSSSSSDASVEVKAASAAVPATEAVTSPAPAPAAATATATAAAAAAVVVEFDEDGDLVLPMQGGLPSTAAGAGDDEEDEGDAAAGGGGKKRRIIVDDEDDVDIAALISGGSSSADDQGMAEEEAEAAGGAAEDEDDANYEVIPPMFEQARRLFLNSEVYPAAEVDLKWEAPDEPALREFLVGKMGFNEERVGGAIKKLVEAQQKKAQKRMDSFFTAAPMDDAAKKRKLEIANSNASWKGKGKPGAKGGAAKGSAFGKKR